VKAKLCRNFRQWQLVAKKNYTELLSILCCRKKNRFYCK